MQIFLSAEAELVAVEELDSGCEGRAWSGRRMEEIVLAPSVFEQIVGETVVGFSNEEMISGFVKGEKVSEI